MHNDKLTAELHQLLATLPVRCDLAAVANLLVAGADVNAADSEGFTPLLRCLKAGCVDLTPTERAPLQAILALLLRHGAHIDVLSMQGHDAQTLASCWNDDGEATKRLACEIYRRNDPYLSQRISEISIYWPAPGTRTTDVLVRSLMKACIAGDLDKVIYFSHVFSSSLGWVDDEVMGFDLTPLIAAAIGTDARKKPALLSFLVDAGCDINKQNEEGNTALHYACSAEYRSPDATYHLITLNADENIRNNAGKTPRDMTHDKGFADGRACEDSLDQALQQRRARTHITSEIHKKSQGGSFKF